MNSFEKLQETEIYRTLNAPSYSLAMASRLCGISAQRVSRWLRGYEYLYEVDYGSEIREGKQSGVIDRADSSISTFVSFLELVDLLFVKRFLDLGLSLQKIRRVLDEARKYLMTPHFASKKFLVSGSHVFLGDFVLPNQAKGLIALLTGGQQAFPEIIEPLSVKIDFEDITEYGLAMRWYPQGRNGDIIVDPSISFGHPTISGSRITTFNVYDLYKGENEKVDKLYQWFDVIPQKIDSAIEFEKCINA